VFLQGKSLLLFEYQRVSFVLKSIFFFNSQAKINLYYVKF
jgi:hypothetical protein